MTDNQEPLTFTLTRLEWKLLRFLITQGGGELMKEFIGGKHSVDCVPQYAAAARKFDELLKEYDEKPTADAEA